MKDVNPHYYILTDLIQSIISVDNNPLINVIKVVYNKE